MSQENVERLRRGFEHFMATGEYLAENTHPDFVRDMSTLPTAGPSRDLPRDRRRKAVRRRLGRGVG